MGEDVARELLAVCFLQAQGLMQGGGQLFQHRGLGDPDNLPIPEHRHTRDEDGFAVAGRLAQLSDPPAVVLVSSRDASSYRRRLAQTLARGFIPKRELSGEALRKLVA